MRVKHWVEENSIQMYDKQGSVLRIETTINNVRRFKVRRNCLGTGRDGDPHHSRRQSGRMTRLIRLLRAHGLIRKVSSTRYYRVTNHGHRTMSTALMLRNADITTLRAA